ncbi:glutathionylspermidine synthase family protein [Brevundimonas sp.]|uniref:glutathionylspermidine synthase family protein n=1 Tax=Brevundimonas sp. TaxID=1871086 RepID=UPI003919AA62
MRKPLFSREGANISIVEGAVREEGLDAGYGEGRHIRQALQAPPLFDGQHVIVGSWLVGDKPAGIALRDDPGRITRNTSRFVPHFIRD